MRHDALRNAGIAVPRSVADGYSAPPRRCDVNGVVTCRRQHDEAQTRQLRKLPVAEQGLVDDEHVGLTGTFHDELRGGTVIAAERSQPLEGFPREVARVHGVSVEKYYVHCGLKLGLVSATSCQ